MRPAVVVSGFTMGLAVIRALGEQGVPVVLVRYDDTDMGQASRYVREVVHAPHPAKEEEAFVERLLAVAPRYDRGLLIPASDAGLVAISKHKQELEDGYVVAATDWDVTRLFIEKRETYALAEKLGVAAPKTTTPLSLEEAERYAENAMYPCLVKPSQGHLYKARIGVKMKRADGRDALLRAYREAEAAGLEVMLQELIPGPDGDGANHNAYVWDGRVLVEHTARKLRGSPPQLGSPRVARSELVPEILEPGRAILDAMGFSGFACTEFKRDDRDGRWKLMEVNGRANLSGMLAVRSGVNFPLLQYRHLIDGIEPSSRGFRSGVCWTDVVRDMSCNVAYAGREGYGLRELIAPYRRPHVDAIWDARDPRPFFVRLWNVARGGLGAALRRLNSSS
jgi:D-aspartate ligase